MITAFVKKIMPAIFLFFFVNVHAQIQLSAGSVIIKLDKKGFLTQLCNTKSGKNYLAADTIAPLLTLVSNKVNFPPSSVAYNKSAETVNLKYDQAGVSIYIKVQSKKNYLVLEIVNATPEKNIDAIIWGPFPTTIKKTIGEVIGVVRDDEIAIGMQVLTIKTIGGDYPNTEGSSWARGIAAKSQRWGSSLQAYTINRNRERTVDAWGGEFKNMPVPPMKGETVVGSKIALFICPEPKTLDWIEAITLAEKLPYPTLNKTWFKRSSLFGKSYLISSFSEKDVD